MLRVLKAAGILAAPSICRPLIRSLPLKMASFATATTAPTFTQVNDLRISLCQFKAGENKPENIDRARAAIEEAAAGKAEMVVLPEIWNSPYATSSFGVYAEEVPVVGGAVDPSSSPSISMLVAEAIHHKLWIIGGSIPEKVTTVDDKPLLFNTCVVVNPEGTIVAKHRKVHLFDIDVPGRIKFKESDSLSPGEAPTVFDTPWGPIGVGICYDIRFPELAMIMRQRGCKLLVYPGAFNMVTGPAHWELLQRARAVDNQLYVAACSPARNETSSYVAWGHSSVVSPWGEVVAKAGHEEEVIFADVKFENVDSMRQSIPCWTQKREDLYAVVDHQRKPSKL